VQCIICRYGLRGSFWRDVDANTIQPSTAELKPIVASFKDTSEPKSIQGSGFHIAGEKYVVIKAEDRSLYGMKVRTCGCCDG
jgi:Profilin